jgi:hypothetical protein
MGADGVITSTEDETERKIRWVEEGAGDRFLDLELQIGAYLTVITDDARGVAEEMAQTFGLTREEMLDHPHALIGSVDAICEQLERRREKFGISYVTVIEDLAERFAPVVERLAGR